MASHPSPTRGHKKKQRTRGQLIAAAIDVIAEQGEAFTASDVTKRAGVSNGTFYNYFTDREALIDAVVPEVLSSFAAASDLAVDDSDPALRFATISAMALQHAATDPDEFRVLLRLDAVQQVLVDGGPVDFLRADLAAGAAAGRFRSTIDDATTDLVVGTLLLAARRIVDHRVDDQYVTRVVVQLLLTVGIDESEAQSLAEHAMNSAQQLVPRSEVTAP